MKKYILIKDFLKYKYIITQKKRRKNLKKSKICKIFVNDKKM